MNGGRHRWLARVQKEMHSTFAAVKNIQKFLSPFVPSLEKVLSSAIANWRKYHVRSEVNKILFFL
jgi:hypothetical protein